MKSDWVRPMFLVAAIYDLVLGIVFLVGYKPLMARLGMELPNHAGYILLPAALITIFGVGFWMIYRAPRRNRDIIKMGILFKFAYSGIVLWFYSRGEMPVLWAVFAAIDLVFLLLFAMALRAIPAPAAEAAA